jgi:hypothetical protein
MFDVCCCNPEPTERAHRQGADHDTVTLSDPAIGDQAAEQRPEVDETGIEPENLRRECLRGERADERFHGGTEPRKSTDVLDMSWQQQLIYQCKGRPAPSFHNRKIVPMLR